MREYFKQRGCLDKSGYPIYEKMFDEIIKIRKMIKYYADDENLIGIEELISTLGRYSLPIIAIKIYFYKAFEKAYLSVTSIFIYIINNWVLASKKLTSLITIDIFCYCN